MDLQHTQVLNAIPPAAIQDDAPFVSNVIDTAEVSYLEFHANLGAIDATAAVFKVVGSDTKTDATTLGGVPVDVHDVTTKPGATDADGVWIIGVDLAKLPRIPRFLQLQATAGNGAAGTFLSATCVLRRSGNTGSEANQRGVNVAEYASAS
ncbi:MAG: hypothetical protein AAGF84_03795 [Planctomycetota bacterium]